MKKQLIVQYLIKLGKSPTIASLLLIAVLLISGCSGGNKPSLDASGQAWVEYPYEGSTLPMGPITLVVYAADPDGISYIHIKVNGQSLPAYTTSPTTTDGSPRLVPMTIDGSSRLVRIDYPWMPTAEGEYTVEASGVNTAGGSGGSGSTHFCIVTCRPETNSPVPTETLVPTETPTPLPAELPIITLPPLSPTPTTTPTELPPSVYFSANFYALPPYINAGQCTTLHWEVQGAQSVYLGNSPVPSSGSQDFCLCETTSYTLTSYLADGTNDKQSIQVDVYGSCASPTTQPPVDTSGPSIGSTSVYWEGCSIYGQASISDLSGVSYAEFMYRLNNGSWISIPMSNFGGNWISQYGIDTGGFAGSIRYRIRAVDIYNNESTSSAGTYNFAYCGG